MDDNALRYKTLMSNSLHTPEHFRKRYKERVSKSSVRALEFAKKSYLLGKDINEIEDKKLRRYLQRKVHYDGGVCKIYRGFICWFRLNNALTIYRIPVIRNKGEYYEKND